MHTSNSGYSLAFSTKTIIKYLVIMIFTSVFLLNLLIGFSNNSTLINSWSVIVLSIYLIFLVRKNIILRFIYSILAYCNYSIVMANYINRIETSYYTSFYNDEVSFIGVNVLFLFLILLTIFTPIQIKHVEIKKNMFLRRMSQNAHLLTFGIVLILFYILIFEFKRPELGNRGTPSALYEYSLTFFIVGFHFLAYNKKSKIILTALLILFALQNFIFGGRIMGLQLILAYFIIFYSHKVNMVKMIPSVVIAYIMMILIGNNRADLDSSLKALNTVIFDLKIKMFTLDTSYAAYFTSLTFLKTEELLTVTERLLLFKQFLLSIFFGGRIPNSNLPTYTRNFYLHYNGGVLPFYFKFYLGYFGVAVASLLPAFYTRVINNLNFNSRGFIKCLSVYIVSSVFRWYLYTPIILLRGVGLLSIVFFSAWFINELGVKKRLD